MAPRTVSFEFDIDEQVKTPFGDLGIVSMLGYDDGGPQYFVKTKEGGNWYKESQLSV